jgi:uncharacterized protein (TIGR02266 family)
MIERTSYRSATRTRLEVEVTLDSESQFFSGLTRDISRGGVFVATYRILPVGRAVVLEFTLPDESRVTATGQVRWIRDEVGDGTAPVGMGIVFDTLSDEDRARIEAFCVARDPLYIELDEPDGA